jgi:hypothetical protein
MVQPRKSTALSFIVEPSRRARSIIHVRLMKTVTTTFLPIMQQKSLINVTSDISLASKISTVLSSDHNNIKNKKREERGEG